MHTSFGSFASGNPEAIEGRLPGRLDRVGFGLFETLKLSLPGRNTRTF
jgi:hypothetical protein